MTWSLFIYTLILCALFAMVEIQIEGGDGWGKSLPAWKVKNPISKLVGWPHIDGYHFWMWIFMLLVFYFPFVGQPFSVANLFVALEMFWIFAFVEDFFWFVFNPRWGIVRFFKDDIPWHPGKFLFFPRDYWISIVALFLLEGVKFLAIGEFF